MGSDYHFSNYWVNRGSDMSNIKCPFCRHKLQFDDLLCSCVNEHCEESFDMVGTEMLWQKVIDLKQEIDGTRKALDRAKWWLHEIVESHRCTPISTAEMALKEITALEQKDGR